LGWYHSGAARGSKHARAINVRPILSAVASNWYIHVWKDKERKKDSRTFQLLRPRIWEFEENFLHETRDAEVDAEGGLKKNHESKEYRL
jgi:hypothetical protein